MAGPSLIGNRQDVEYKRMGMEVDPAGLVCGSPIPSEQTNIVAVHEIWIAADLVVLLMMDESLLAVVPYNAINRKYETTKAVQSFVLSTRTFGKGRWVNP